MAIVQSWPKETLNPYSNPRLEKALALLKEDRYRREKNVFFIDLLDWQHPCLTEKQAMFNHIFHHRFPPEGQVYFAFPWATIIDLESEFKLKLNEHSWRFKDALKEREGSRIHTVCQHIRWREFLGFWREFGITDLHVSHCELNDHEAEGMKIHSWPIIATNYESPERMKGISIKENKHKKYLVSFMGNHDKDYRSDIRPKLLELLKNETEVFYELGSKWFYDSTVYRFKNLSSDESEDQKTIKYNQIMSDSIFSLCPEGSGPNTIRLWESMAVGSIPVIFSNGWKPPEIEGLCWNDFSVRIPLDEYKHTLEILKSISNDQRDSMKHNCLTAYKKFASMRCF